jgi:hypothetical protein
VGFVVDKVALGQVFSEHFGFPCQFSFHQLHINHPTQHNFDTGSIVKQHQVNTYVFRSLPA